MVGNTLGSCFNLSFHGLKCFAKLWYSDTFKIVDKNLNLWSFPWVGFNDRGFGLFFRQQFHKRLPIVLTNNNFTIKLCAQGDPEGKNLNSTMSQSILLPKISYYNIILT